MILNRNATKIELVKHVKEKLIEMKGDKSISTVTVEDVSTLSTTGRTTRHKQLYRKTQHHHQPTRFNRHLGNTPQ